MDGWPDCDLVENGTKHPTVMVILTGEVLLVLACPSAGSGSLCQRAEQGEPSGVPWALLTSVALWWEMLCWSCGVPVQRGTLPAPGCPKHPFIDLKSQFNSTRVNVRYFQITHSGQLFAAEVDRSAL